MQGRCRDGNGPWVIGGRTANPVMDRGRDEEWAPRRDPAADFKGMQGIGIEGEMGTVLLGGTKRDEDRPGLRQSAGKVRHGQVGYEHGGLRQTLRSITAAAENGGFAE